MERLKKIDPEIYAAIMNEVRRQEENLEMIASENFTSDAPQSICVLASFVVSTPGMIARFAWRRYVS